VLWAWTLALTYMGLHAFWQVSLNGDDPLYLWSWWWSPPPLPIPTELMPLWPELVFDRRISWPTSIGLAVLASAQLLLVWRTPRQCS
jgi:hypothetical protein